jgi:hypothetical protein
LQALSRSIALPVIAFPGIPENDLSVSEKFI